MSKILIGGSQEVKRNKYFLTIDYMTKGVKLTMLTIHNNNK